MAVRCGGLGAVGLGCLATAVDRRRRSDRSANGAKPVGGQRTGLQSRRTGGIQYLDRVDLPVLPRQSRRRTDATGVRGAGAGAGAECGRHRNGHVGHGPVVGPRSAGSPGVDASGRCAGVHRNSPGPRFRHLRPRERSGDGLARTAVVDVGVLVASLATARVVPRGGGLRGGPECAGAPRVGAHRRAGPGDDAGGCRQLAASGVDRAGRWRAPGRIPNLSNGVLRPAGAADRVGQGRLW